MVTAEVEMVGRSNLNGIGNDWGAPEGGLWHGEGTFQKSLVAQAVAASIFFEDCLVKAKDLVLGGMNQVAHESLVRVSL